MTATRVIVRTLVVEEDYLMPNKPLSRDNGCVDGQEDAEGHPTLAIRVRARRFPCLGPSLFSSLSGVKASSHWVVAEAWIKQPRLLQTPSS